jgi:hypothetical protein
MGRRVFGREPAAILNVFSAMVALMIGMGWFGLTENQGQAVIGVVSAGTSVWIAFAVRPLVPTMLTGLITSGFAFLAAFDWVHVTERQTGLWVAFAEIALTALAVRPHSTPVVAPAPADHTV